MGDYARSTREVAFADFSVEVKDALNKHVALYNLGAIWEDALLCVEATSEKIKKGLFAGSGAKMVKVSLVLTPRWLLQVLKSDNDAAFARSAQLTGLVVADYEQSLFYAKIPDTGVNVTGIFTGASESSMSFIGLGKDAAGEKFKTMLLEAVQRVRK